MPGEGKLRSTEVEENGAGVGQRDTNQIGKSNGRMKRQHETETKTHREETECRIERDAGEIMKR